MVEYSVGIVTAYGSAKRAGYTGTYEDFCRQQAQYAQNAFAVEQAKETAVSASQSADQAKQDAQTASTTAQSASQSAQGSAQLAGQSAQDAQTAESNAQTHAQSASASAGSAQQSAQSAQAVLESIPEDYSDLSEDVDQLKADLDDKSPIITDNITTTAINKSVLTFGGNYYPSTTGVKTELSTQYWYEALALTDFQLWKDESFTYTSAMVAIYNNGEATSDNFVARYRKSSSEDTLPTSNNKLSITKGQLLVISCSNDAEFTFVSNGFPTGKSVFKNNVLLSGEQLAEVQDKMQVVCGTNAYNIKYGDLNIALAYTSRENTRAELWNFNGITKGAYTVLTAGTDIVGVVKEDGESDYMGGVHGDETNEEFHILADGVPVTQDVYCDRVDILMVSTLTRVSTGDSVLKRYVHIVINRNVIEIETTFKCLVDNFSVYSACAGGMWAYYEADKTFAMSNIGELVGTGSVGVKIQEDHALYTATAFLQSATVTCENLIGSNVDGTLGQAYYYGNESNPRMKLYLGMLKNVTWNAGDYWKGKSRYTIY